MNGNLAAAHAECALVIVKVRLFVVLEANAKCTALHAAMSLAERRVRCTLRSAVRVLLSAAPGVD